MVDVLKDILIARRQSVEKTKETRPLADLEDKANRFPVRSFLDAVSTPDQISLIAEMKKQSPSAGSLREPYVVEEIATAYENGGASALSVLTEPYYFKGDIDHIQRVRDASVLPILRKDFLFDPYQIVESRACGADAVLLIADMLDIGLLTELIETARQYRIEPLVEVFSSDVVPAVLNLNVKCIGINSRNLRTLEMAPENIIRISRLIPRDRFVVAESGLKTSKDVETLKALSISAMLVGESLLRQKDLTQAVRVLVSAGQKYDESKNMRNYK